MAVTVVIEVSDDMLERFERVYRKLGREVPAGTIDRFGGRVFAAGLRQHEAALAAVTRPARAEGRSEARSGRRR